MTPSTLPLLTSASKPAGEGGRMVVGWNTVLGGRRPVRDGGGMCARALADAGGGVRASQRERAGAWSWAGVLYRQVCMRGAGEDITIAMAAAGNND